VVVVVYANISDKEINAKTVEVIVYANIRDKGIHAKTVEVVVSASIREEEVHAKTVEVVRYANIREEEVNAKTVRTCNKMYLVSICRSSTTHFLFLLINFKLFYDIIYNSLITLISLHTFMT